MRDIEVVAQVQRRFTKRLPGLRNMSYDKRLKFLNVPSLELRRLHADLFWCYKVVFGLAKVQSDVCFFMNPCMSRAATNTNYTNVIVMSTYDLLFY